MRLTRIYTSQIRVQPLSGILVLSLVYIYVFVRQGIELCIVSSHSVGAIN